MQEDNRATRLLSSYGDTAQVELLHRSNKEHNRKPHALLLPCSSKLDVLRGEAGVGGRV